jgi:hypothetical protein
MVRHLHRRSLHAKWLEPGEGDDSIFTGGASLGVALKRPNGTFVTEPADLDPDMIHVMQRIGCKVAFTMSSEITAALFQTITPLQSEVIIQPRNIKVPIVESLATIANGEETVSKDSYLCFLRHERTVLVWNDSVESILAHGTDVESKLLALVSPFFYLLLRSI